MWAYLILFIFPAVAALGGRLSDRSRQWLLPLAIYSLIFVLLVGLRDEVGGDWANYVLAVDDAQYVSFWDHVTGGWDPGYEALNWISAQLGMGVYLVNVACAIMFLVGLVHFASARASPWLAITVAIPYLTVVVVMGYSRQGVAIGFILLALVALERGHIFRFLAWIAVAALFHKTAVVLAPIAMFSASKERWKQIFWTSCFTAVAVGVFLVERLEGLYDTYSVGGYESGGVVFRVAANAIPAVIFLIWRRRFKLTREGLGTWTFLSITSLLFIPLLASPLSTTILDRMALYWIPLQLLVFSELPAAMSHTRNASAIRIAIVGYSLFLLLGWLTFAQHAEYWRTYEFLPFAGVHF